MKRYHITAGDGPGIYWDEEEWGDWVRYEDVEMAVKVLQVHLDTSRDAHRAAMDDGRELAEENRALRETLDARQVAAEYSRRQCEKAEASLRVAEMLLADCANWLITAPEDARDGDESKRLIELREAIRKELKLT